MWGDRRQPGAFRARAEKHVVKRGKTPVLTPAEARKLLDAIDVSKFQTSWACAIGL